MNSEQQISIRTDSDGVTITGTGALDLYDESFAPAVKEAASSAENVIVDLRAATYIDTAILSYLAMAANRMFRRGRRMRVMLTEGSHPLRTLNITGLDAIVDLVTEKKPE